MPFTALQMHALAQQISADAELSRKYYLGDGVRILEHNAQRGLTAESARWFRQRFGKSAEEIVAEINAAHDREVLAAAAAKKVQK